MLIAENIFLHLYDEPSKAQASLSMVVVVVPEC